MPFSFWSATMAAKKPTSSADATISTMNTVISAIPDSSWRREPALILCSLTRSAARRAASLHIVVDERHAAQCDLRGQRVVEKPVQPGEFFLRPPGERDCHLVDLGRRAVGVVA